MSQQYHLYLPDMINKTQSDFLNFARWSAAGLVVIEHVRNLLFVDYGSLEKTGVGSKAFYFLTGFGHEAVVIFFVIVGFWLAERCLSFGNRVDSNIEDTFAIASAGCMRF